MNKDLLIKAVLTALVAALTAAVAILFPSCSAVRTVTTSSEYTHRGDTSVIIQTKTIERYDGQKVR